MFFFLRSRCHRNHEVKGPSINRHDSYKTVSIENATNYMRSRLYRSHFVHIQHDHLFEYSIGLLWLFLSQCICLSRCLRRRLSIGELNILTLFVQLCVRTRCSVGIVLCAQLAHRILPTHWFRQTLFNHIQSNDCRIEYIELQHCKPIVDFDTSANECLHISFKLVYSEWRNWKFFLVFDLVWKYERGNGWEKCKTATTTMFNSIQSCLLPIYLQPFQFSTNNPNSRAIQLFF